MTKRQLIRIFLPISLSICYSLTLSGQVSAQSRPPRFIFGVESGGSLFTPSRNNPANLSKAWSVRTAPYLNIQVGKRWYFGGNFEHESGKIDGVKTPRYLGFGLQTRYYPVLPIKDAILKDRMQFYAAGGLSLLDHAIDRNADYGLRQLGGFSNVNANFSAGMNLRLLNSLYLDVTFGPRIYSKGKFAQLAKTFALEYHFGEKRAPLPPLRRPVKEKNQKMRPFDLSYLFKRTTIGTSFSFGWDDPDTGNPFYYTDYMWYINIATALTSDIDVGLNIIPMKVVYEDVNDDRLLYGAFLQYNFLRKYRGIRLFGESGFYRGNHCSCGYDYGYKKENLSYLSLGAGFEAPIVKGLYLEMAFMFNYIATKISEDKWTFNRPLIGLNYRFE